MGGRPAVRLIFASGTAELNHAVIEHFAGTHGGDLPLIVVSEFQPLQGEWIPWHVFRLFEQNLESVQAALAQRDIAIGALVFDHRANLPDMHRAAHALARGKLVAYDELLNFAPPGRWQAFRARRAVRNFAEQFQAGGRGNIWLRRLIHPSEAEIPLRARLAQARGIAANRHRRPASPRRLPVSPGLKPGVTIVIPSRDGLDLLRESLPPLLEQFDESAMEIIVVDNGSGDGTAVALAREFSAVRVMVRQEPLSFARAVNEGIRTANYTHTLLLNNDMFVEPGFIPALVRGFEQVPDLFCATAQIQFPPGFRREETGKTVWRRTSELDFPIRCDDPLPGEDLTWVLYGSGGCSLFDTVKLASLGGVSEIYEPAYVEDLDFGFRAWQRGWPTVYCAGARAEHRHRSTTARFYNERQLDFFTERNYLRFVANAVAETPVFERLWSEGIRRLQLQAMNGRGAALDTLRDVPPVGPAVPQSTGHLNEEEILALSNGDLAIFPGCSTAGGRTVLIASPYLPFPLSHGGAVRIYNLMKATASTSRIILMAFVDELLTPAAELLSLCHAIVLVRRHGSHYRRDTSRPDAVEEFDSSAFRACLKQAVHQYKPDLVQLEFTWMAQYADACRPAKTILVEHDITFDLQQQLLDASPDQTPVRLELSRQLAKWRAFEAEAWKKVDAVVVMSEKDRLAVHGARAVACLPNGVDCGRFQPTEVEPEPRRLLLVGSFAHLPNLLALEYFLRAVWPLLRPGFTLHVIGGIRHDYYLDFFKDRVSLDLEQPGIELEGFVSDVRAAYQRAAIVLAPLTASAGTNIKVLEAMAMGKAVVSTPAGVNGLSVTSDDDVVITHSGDEMARRIDEIAGDPALRSRIERNARQTALRFDWASIATGQQSLYDRLAGGSSDIQ